MNQQQLNFGQILVRLYRYTVFFLICTNVNLVAMLAKGSDPDEIKP
jgi:hypothetical protein